MQGFNMGRYVPPDQEGVVSGNRLLGNRAQKATAAGVPIVRFEMPFAVWCDGCEARTVGRDGKTHPVLIGQGARFNAEKHRTGSYYSTPIWTFRMRHPACGTWLAIRTDPATTSYIVAEGGRRRREYNDDEGATDDPAAAAAASAAALAGIDRDTAADDGDAADRLNAFDRLERTIAHRAADTAAADAAVDAAHRIGALARQSARQWEDPYTRNRALRAAFREGRHARERAAADDEGLRRRLGGLSEDLHLLPATEADARHAALVDFGGMGGGARPGSETPSAVADRRTLAKPLLLGNGGQRGGAASSSSSRRIGKSVSLPVLPGDASPSSSPLTSSRNNTYAPTTQAAKRQRSIRDHLASTVLANTRLTTDPFVTALASGSRGAAARTKPPLKGLLKRSATAAEIGCSTSGPKRAREADGEDGQGERRSSHGTASGSTDEIAPAKTTAVADALVSYDSD